MVTKRQREAKKRFRDEHPDLFPEPEPTPPKDPNKVKKKKNKPNTKFKRQKSDSNDPNKKSSHRRHVLRVPGMRPGETCYICKAVDHIAKNCPRKSEWERNKICLMCRQHGHSLKNCPNKDEMSADTKTCYNCGEMGHSLSHCPQPLQDGGTKYAKCFVCSESGHLSKDCPKNTHGIYPKGGCCKICGGVTHLARDCPNRLSISSGVTGFADQSLQRPNKITKFTSGDDLEDDFVEAAVPVPAADGNNKSVKKKSKEGPKVVNFVG